MARLYRPPIPLEVRCRVALRQLEEPAEPALEMWRRRLGGLLLALLTRLAKRLDCEVADLRLDHDPPLGARARRGEGRKTVYRPAANDPAHLGYRPHGTQFAGSHDVKTRIRGDHGQYSDVVLIKRERRRQRNAGSKSRSTGFPKSSSPVKHGAKKPKSAVRRRYRWPKRKFQTRKNP